MWNVLLNRPWARTGLVGLLLLAGNGCQDKSPAPADKGPAAARVSEAQTGEIEDQLKSALYQLQPEHLDIDARLDDAVSVLNNWWSAVKEANLEPKGLVLPDLPAERLAAAQRAAVQRDTFDAADGRAIRSAYFAKAIADQATAGVANELDRIVKLFEWTCRNIALESEAPAGRAMTLYEILITGRGSAVDRAWVFAALLKQQRWDLVVLHAADVKIENPEAPWVVGVVHDGEAYLFDLRLGLPIPNPESHTRPATLRQAIAHPEWLTALSPRADQPYEPNAEQLQSSVVEVFTPPVTWSPRMWSVEQLLPGESLCVLYEAPGRLGDLDGVFERVAKAGDGWTADQVQVWSYPADQEARFLTMDDRLRQRVDREMVPFLMPMEMREDREAKRRVLVQTMQQLQIRLDQLYGRRADAVSQYVTIRQLAVMTPPQPGLGPVYQQAADDAHYFSCVCKAEGSDLDAAVKALADYVKKSRRSGRWGPPARSLLADCQAAQDNLTAAAQTLRVQESDDPYRARHAVLLSRWSKAKSSTADDANAAQP